MIYYYVYPSAFQNPGGGEILLLKTKEYVEKAGKSVRLFDMWNDRLQSNDLLHVFGSVKEALGLMESAKAKGTKIIHSPIVWYNWQSSSGIEYSTKERILCFARQMAKTYLPQLPSSRKRMMELADVVLAGSEGEANQIAKYFLISKEKIKVIPYGVDQNFEKVTPEIFQKKYGLSDFVLMVGRIEPRKNQLNLIKAMNHVDRPLVLIGNPVAHHIDYYERCKRLAGKNVHLISQLKHDSDELKSAFAACSVFALPTWFETPGLAALEAGIAGANIVITQEGCTREYFKDFATYVNPANIEDIRNKIIQNLLKSKNNALQTHIKQKYLWTYMADKISRLYETFNSNQR